MEINLKENPFFLNDEEVAWVEKTREGLTLKQKVGQLFCVMGGDYTIERLSEMVGAQGVGAVLYRPAPADEINASYDILDKHAAVPLLKAANLEEGGSGGISDGTLFGWPMTVGAADDDTIAAGFAAACAAEGRKVGINWTFSPVSDLSINPLNPITNVRAFGSDRELVKRMTRIYTDNIQRYGIAACAKHFPGDGVDFRDQHLHPTYNSLSADEWYDSYGEIYKNLISSGLLSIMTGHIACPAVSMKKNPKLSFEDCLPGSLSYELLTGVLREEFGFNGVITTDATIMGGFTMNMPRRDAIPAAILAGADVLVFSTDFDEDYGYLLAAVSDGRISPERLDESVTRILALKARLILRDYPIPEIDIDEMAEWCASEAVTLVKDTTAKMPEAERYLPGTPERYKSIRLVLLGSDELYDGSIHETAMEYLSERGFEVELYDPYADELHGTAGLPDDRLSLYIANEQTASNRTTVRLDWCKKHALDIPRFVCEERSIFISLSNPYHLMDIPRIPVYINAYSATRALLVAALKKVTGEEAFSGKSPVDAFCGLPDTRL